MKLADAPDDVRAALDAVRYLPFGKPPRHPANDELWFDEACAVCGQSADHGLDRDHCHITGLYRGRLCRGCNVAEGFSRGDHWPFWRLHAPGFAERKIERGDRSPYLEDDEVLTLPMATLFAIHDLCEEVAFLQAQLRRRASAERRAEQITGAAS